MATKEIQTARAPARRTLPGFTDQLIEPLSRLRTEMDRLFEDFPFRLPSLHFDAATSLAVPAVEMKETDKAYKLSAELPGMDPGEVEVTFEDGLLRIAGEKKEEREENERGYRLSERSYGSFERLIELPSAADGDKIKASFKNGVLKITVPKNAEAAPRRRRIAIDGG